MHNMRVTREASCDRSWLWLVPIVCGAMLWAIDLPRLGAQTRDAIALSGQVTSAEEGPMEGVLVSAKTGGVHDHGHRRHRRAGPLSLPRIPAGARRRMLFAFARSATTSRGRDVDVARRRPRRVDLKLQQGPRSGVATHQLGVARELSRAPTQQKASIRGCAHCHTLERIARIAPRRGQVDGRHRAHVHVSAALVPAARSRSSPAPRIGGGAGSARTAPQAAWRRQARVPDARST